MYAVLGLMWFIAVLIILSLYREYRKDEMMRKYREEIARMSGRTYRTEIININDYRTRTKRAG